MQPHRLLPEAQVELLRRQYFQLQDPQQLAVPGPAVIKAPEIQAQIYKTMFRDDCLKFPPPARYRLRVLKRIMAGIERAITDPEEDEISDDLSAALATLMAEPAVPPTTLAQQKHYVTYSLPAPLLVGAAADNNQQPDAAPAPAPWRPITLLESQDVLAAAGTTGRRTWEAALWLGSYLASPHGTHWVAGKTVLELGAGTGFLTVLAARHLGAAFVLATDGSGEVVDDLGPNLYLNGLDRGAQGHGAAAVVDTAVLQWGHGLIEEVLNGTEERRRFDLVLGSDLNYDTRSVRPLVATLGQLLARDRGCKALISATLRNEATMDLLETVCGEQKLSIERLEVPSGDPDSQVGLFHRIATPIRIYLIRSQ